MAALASVKSASTKYAISMMETLLWQVSRGLTINRAKGRHLRLAGALDLGLFPAHIAELWDWCQSATSRRQFRTRLEYFIGLAKAHLQFLGDNDE